MPIDPAWESTLLQWLSIRAVSRSAGAQATRQIVSNPVVRTAVTRSVVQPIAQVGGSFLGRLGVQTAARYIVGQAAWVFMNPAAAIGAFFALEIVQFALCIIAALIIAYLAYQILAALNEWWYRNVTVPQILQQQQQQKAQMLQGANIRFHGWQQQETISPQLLTAFAPMVGTRPEELVSPLIDNIKTFCEEAKNKNGWSMIPQYQLG